MKKTFITSDIWFNRPNGKYSDVSTSDYNETIVSNWNKVVKPNDVVYVLGGLGISDMYYILLNLNGEIHILDNFYNSDEEWSINTLKESIDMSTDVKLNGRIIFEKKQIMALPEEDIIMSYFPLNDWMGKHTGTYCFHGLSSDNNISERHMSCKMSEWDFTPVDVNKVRKMISEFESRV